MIDVAVSTSRWLGMRILETLEAEPVRVVGVHWDRKSSRFPGDPKDPSAVIGRTGWKFYEHAMNLPEADILVSSLTSWIFPDDQLARYQQAVNLHPADLPRYRGCNTYSWAIENEEPYYGVTLHHMVPGVDQGPIIAQRFVPVYHGDLGQDTAWSLYKRAQVAAHELFCAELPKLMDTALMGVRHSSREQDDGQARYYARADRPSPKTFRAWSFPGLSNVMEAA